MDKEYAVEVTLTFTVSFGSPEKAHAEAFGDGLGEYFAKNAVGDKFGGYHVENVTGTERVVCLDGEA